MSKRDAKIELIRLSIAVELERARTGTLTVGRNISLEYRPVYAAGLRRALEILDKINEDVS